MDASSSNSQFLLPIVCLVVTTNSSNKGYLHLLLLVLFINDLCFHHLHGYKREGSCVRNRSK
jgi:hypothetical protein